MTDNQLINVIGLGYIGLPTALVLAANGHRVVGTDVKKKIIDELNQNQIPFTEQGIEHLFQQARENQIQFTTKYQSASFYIITVPTPYNPATKKIDSSYVVKAVQQVIDSCLKETIIVIESTVSPGTIDHHVRPLLMRKSAQGKTIHIVHAPERILPGRMIAELRNNARTIGADDPVTAEIVKKVYQSFCAGEIVLTDIRSAELSKVVENTYRDINIAFANELTKMCNFADLDVHEIISLANRHPRVNILSPGPGVGGHCISVDPWFLVGDYPEQTPLIATARKVNDSMPDFVLKKIKEIAELENITDSTRIGLYGLSYKADVDDIRESPTLQLFERLKDHFATPFKVFDPMVLTRRVNSQVLDFDEFLNEVDLVVIMAAHQHVVRNQDKIADKIVLDTQHCLPDCYYL